MLRVLIGLGLACVLCGCGGNKRVPVSGKLTADGKPLAGAGVTLLPTDASQTQVAGATGEDGSFTLVDVHDGKPGAVPGPYKVVVMRLVTGKGTPLPRGAKQVDYPDARESMPSKLTSVTETPVTTTIPPGGGEVTIDLPRELFGRAGPPGS